MAQAKLNISRIITNVDGAVVITPVSAVNAAGAWRLTSKQFNRLAGSCGLTTQQLCMVKGTLVVDGKNVKKGEKWSETDRKTGEITREGVFEKDHFRVEELSIELTPQQLMSAMVASSLAAQFMTSPTELVSTPAPVVAEVAETFSTEDILGQ